MNEVVAYHRSVYPDDPRTDDDLTLLAAEQAPIQQLSQFPNYMADLSRIRQEQAVAGSSMLGELGSGLYRGTLGAGQAVTGGLSLLSGALGAQGAKEYYQEAYRNLAQKAAEEAPASVPTIGGAFTSFPAAGQYLAGKVGEFIPAVGEAAAASAIGSAVAPGPGTAAGGLGSLFARGATRAALRKYVLDEGISDAVKAELGDYVAGKIAGSALSEGAAKAVTAASQFAGATGATAGAFGAMSAGPTYAELSGRPGVSEPAAMGAAALSGVGGSLGALVSLPVLKQIFGQEIPSATYIDLFAKKIPAEVLTAGGGMGAMEFMNILAEHWADPEKRDKPWGQEEYSKLLNATVDGILMSAPHAIYAGIKGPEKPPTPTTPEAAAAAAAEPTPAAPAAAAPVAPAAPTITPGMTAAELISAYGMKPEVADTLRKLAVAEVQGTAGAADQAVLKALFTSPAEKVIYEKLKQEVSDAAKTGQVQGSVLGEREGADGRVQGETQDRDKQAAEQKGGVETGPGDSLQQTAGQVGQVGPPAKTAQEAADKASAGQRQPPPGLPPVPPGYVRFYHGGVPGTGGRDVSPFYFYAKAYAEKSPGGVVQYVDIPESHPDLRKAFDDSDPGMPKSYYQAFHAPEGITKNFKTVPGSETPADPIQAAVEQIDPAKQKAFQALTGVDLSALHTAPEPEAEPSPVEKVIAAAKESAVLTKPTTATPETKPTTVAPMTDQVLAETRAITKEIAEAKAAGGMAPERMAELSKRSQELLAEMQRIREEAAKTLPAATETKVETKKEEPPPTTETKTTEPPPLPKAKKSKDFATDGTWEVEIGGNTYRFFFDRDSHMWYEDKKGSDNHWILASALNKEDAIRSLVAKYGEAPSSFDKTEKQLALDRLHDVNAALARGETEHNGHPIQSAKDNAVEGMLEAGWTNAEVSKLYDSVKETKPVEAAKPAETGLKSTHLTEDGKEEQRQQPNSWLVDHAAGKDAWKPATEARGPFYADKGKHATKNPFTKAIGVFRRKSDGKIVVAQLSENNGFRVSNSPESTISWDRFMQDHEAIGHFRTDEHTKNLYAEYTPEQWKPIEDALKAKAAAAKAEVVVPTTETETVQDIKQQVGGKVVEGKEQIAADVAKKTGISEELATRIHEAALQLLPTGHLKGVDIGYNEARRAISTALAKNVDLQREITNVAGTDRAMEMFVKILNAYGHAVEKFEEGGTGDPEKLREDVVNALKGLSVAGKGDVPQDDIARSVQLPGERSAAQQKGSNPIDIAQHIERRLADLGIPVHMRNVAMDSLVRQLRVAGGWFDRVDKAITLVMDDTTVPSNADIRVLFEEAAHALFDRETPELRDSLMRAILALETKRPEDFDLVRRRMALAYPDGLPSRAVEAEELVMGYLSQKLSSEGFNPVQAQGIAASLMRLVKNAYLSGMMWLQQNVLGREYTNPDLMMRYWQNRLEHWMAGTTGPAWMDFLGGALPSFTKQISWHDAAEGTKPLKEFYDPVTTLIKSVDNVSDSIEALMLNLQGDRVRFSTAAPGAMPERPVDPAIKYNREEAANNLVRELRYRIAKMIKPEIGPPSPDTFRRANGLHDVERKAEIIQAQAIADKAVNFKKGQKIEDFAEGGESSGKAYKNASNILKNEMAQVQRNWLRDTETLQKKIQEREGRLERLDKFKDRYKDAQFMADLIKKGFRNLARADIRELVRAGRVHGAIMQQLEEISQAEGKPVSDLAINSLRKLYTGEGLHGDTLFNVLNAMANDPNIDFSQKASQIKAYVQSNAALQGANAVHYLHLAEEPGLLAAAIAFGKMNRRVMNALQMRGLKAEDRLAAEKDLADLKKETYEQLDTGIRKIGKSASIREAAKNDWRRELRNVARLNRHTEYLAKRIDMNWRALPEYQAELDRIAKTTALHSPEDTVMSDGMVVKVPLSHERNTEWEHQTISLDAQKGPPTDVKPILEKFAAYIAMREQEAAHGDDTALGQDYQRTKQAERELLYAKVFDPIVRNADGFTTGLVMGNVATAMESIGTPTAKLIGRVIRQYVADNQEFRQRADSRFGEKVVNAEDAVVAELNRGRKASGRMDPNWFHREVRNAIFGFSEKFQSDETKDREANKKAHLKALGDWLLKQELFSHYMEDRMGTLMPKIEKMLDVNYEAGQYWQKIIEEHGLLVMDPQLKALRKSIPVGLYTFQRRFSDGFSNMVNALRLSGWGTTGRDKEGKVQRPAVFGDFAKVADAHTTGGADAVNALVNPYLNNPEHGGTVRDWFLFKLFHPVDESVLDSPHLDESGLTTKIDPVLTGRAYDQANGDITRALEKIYDEIKPAGNESKAEFIQKSYLQLAEVYDDMNKALANIEPGAVNVQGLVGLVPNAMIDARAFEHLPGEWFDYHRFDRNGNARMAERVSAQLHFGREGRRLAGLHEGLVRETNAFVGKLDAVMGQAEREVPSGKRSAINKRAAELLALDKGAEFSGMPTGAERLQFLKRMEKRTSSIVSKFVGQMTDYFHRNNQQEGSLRWGIRVAQELAQLMVNKMTTAIGQLSTIFDVPLQWGVSPATAVLTGKVGYYTAKDIAGSLVQAVGMKFLRLNEEEARYISQGMNDAAVARGMGNIMNLLKGRLPASLEGEKGVTKFFRVLSDIQQQPINFRGEKAEYTGFRPLAPFSQFVMSVNRAITVGVNQLAKAYVTRGMEFLERNPGAEKITAEDIFTKGMLKSLDRDSFNRWQKSINNYGLDFTDMVRGALKRKASGEKTILTNREFGRMYSIGLADISQESNLATMPLWAYNRWGARFTLPLLGWGYRRSLQVAEQLGGLGTGDKRKLSAFGTSLLGLAATGLGGLAVSMLQDDFQEEVLGKKRNLRDARIPITGNDWIAMNERMNRVGTLGLWGELANSALNVGTGVGDNRDFSVDNRVVALQSFGAIKRTIQAYVNQDFDADYKNVVRPAIEAIGGDGMLQYMQILNHAFDFDNVESRMVRRVNAGNYLSVVGRDLGLPVRSSGGYAAPTPTTPWISRMEFAAYGNDPADFRAAYRGALQSAKEQGKEDPADYVKKAYESHHPLRLRFAQTITEQEYRQILSNLNDEGRADVTEAIRLFNHYGESLGLQPYAGKKAKTGSPTSTIQNAQLRALMR